MVLTIPEIYKAAVQGVRSNLLIYLLLLGWGVVQGVLLFVLLSLGMALWLGNAVVALNQQGDIQSVLYLTAAFVVLALLIVTFLSAATRAGILAFGAKIRKGEKAGGLDFFRGILRHTFPLFIGGIVVGMLTCIPVLALLLILKIGLADAVTDIITSGWNYGQSLELIRYVWNTMMVVGVIQALVFFWIAPWDEMLVLYRLPYPEALSRSFSFVFSRRHFPRVVGLMVVNIVIAQLILILSNFGIFLKGLEYNIGFAYIGALANASHSTLTSFFQFILLPFFAYTQLYLLPSAAAHGIKDSKEGN